MPHKYLLKEFEEYARTATAPESLMQHVAQRIHMHIPRYNWVGFYLTDKKDASTLMLGSYTGSFTPSPKVSLDQSLCGTAATTRRVIVIDDVAESPGVHKTSDLVKSQIFVPVLAHGKTVAIFVVESYFKATFKNDVERNFVEACAGVVGKCMAKSIVADFVNV